MEEQQEVEKMDGLRTIESLSGMTFRVAAYQRGYKWGTEEVVALLEDIHNFKPANDQSFYCLQPLVVSKISDQCWELIDGQQRLTTIFMILKFLGHQCFHVEYVTREGSKEFLEKIGLESKPEGNFDNIDNHHFCAAYQAIAKWFGGKCDKWKERLLDTLLTQTRVIWHEVGGKDHHQVFQEINGGKIPLTNAELIKALFLKEGLKEIQGGDEKAMFRLKTEVAQEWDRMEYALQDSAFWSFLGGKEDHAGPRIDFVFDLIAEKSKEKSKSESQGLFFSYRFYEAKKLGPIKEITDAWGEVKACFFTLREWFEVRDLYHDVGFLICRGVEVSTIYSNSKDKTRTGFKGWVKKEIVEKVKTDLDSLEYGQNNSEILSVLLLFNVKSMSGNERFSFDRYREGKWDLEHIHAQNPRKPARVEEWRAWEEGMVGDLNAFIKEKESITPEEVAIANSLLSQLAVVEKAPKDEVWEKIDADGFRLLGGNGIGNLALLPSGINRSIGNNRFIFKREEIMKGDMANQFIPIATKNVFLKYYSLKDRQMEIWTGRNRAAYLMAIQDKLADYLPEVKAK